MSAAAAALARRFASAARSGGGGRWAGRGAASWFSSTPPSSMAASAAAEEPGPARAASEVVVGSSSEDKRGELFGSLRSCGSASEVEAVLVAVRPLRSAREYTLAIGALGRAGKTREALALLAEMDPPDIIAYGAALSACSREGLWMQAVGLLDEMREKGVEADLIAYSTAIMACKRRGQWRKAIDVLESMPMPPDAQLMNGVIAACSRRGQHAKARQLLDDMSAKYGLQPDVISYNSCIAACSRARRGDLAVELLEEMRQRGLEPDRVTYNTTISALAKADSPDSKAQAEAMAKAMPFEPDDATHAALISISEPAVALERFEALGDVKHVSVWNALLTALSASHEARDRVMDFYRQIPNPNFASHGHAVAACEAAGDWRQAVDIAAPLVDTSDNLRDKRWWAAVAVSACLKGQFHAEAEQLATANLLGPNRYYVDLRRHSPTVAAFVLRLALNRRPRRLTVHYERRKRAALDELLQDLGLNHPMHQEADDRLTIDLYTTTPTALRDDLDLQDDDDDDDDDLPTADDKSPAAADKTSPDSLR